MQAKQSHAHDIETGDKRVFEADDHHFENIVPFLRIHEIDEILASEIDIFYLNGEMQKVVNDEDEDDDPAHQHRARCVSRSRGIPIRISDRPGRAVFSRQFDRCPDMQDQHEKQEEPRRPDQLGVGLKKMAVAVDSLGPEKNLKISGEMADDEQKHDQTGNRHDIFLAQRRFENV